MSIQSPKYKVQKHRMVDDMVLKVIVIGDGGCGKTSLIRRYIDNTFQSSCQPTLGVDFTLKFLSYKNQPITMQVWDIAGQERTVGTMTRVYFHATVGAMVVFDLSRSEQTLPAAVRWKEDLDSKATRSPEGSTVPCVLVGSKCDLAPDVPRSDADMKEFCERHSFTSFFETSALNNINIEEAFQGLLGQIIMDREGGVEPKTPSPNCVIRAFKKKEPLASSSCC